MSQSQPTIKTNQRKYTQAQRRAIAKILEKKITIISKMIKPKPKWCPRFIWQWGARQYMDIDLLKQLLGQK